MQSLFFWNSWQKDYRWLWYGLIGIFSFSIILLWIYYFHGAAAVIDWERLQEQKIIETTVHSFRLGPFQLAVPAESYVIFEYLSGSDLQHNLFATGIFLTVLSLCSVVLLAIITTLDRFWYFAGMSLFIVFMITIRLDVLQVFGSSGYVVPACVLMTYIIVSFYFKYFRSRTSLLFRCLTFLLITIILAGIIALFSKVNYPSVNLMVTAYIPALVLSILFIIMVAHEILVSFIYLTNHGTGNNLKHFSLLSFIYMAYVIITCLHELGVIHWDFIYINIFLLITVSAVLGIWGFKLREPQFENIFPFAPLGALFFIALGSVCFITMAQLLGNANDSALQIIRYTIIFTHAGYGIIFLTYFFSNFMVMMAGNLPVYSILYRPNRMPYFTFRFAGLIASLAFLLYSNWRDFVSHGVAGLYNYAGDMYMLQSDEGFAQSFYEQSRTHSFQSNRPNYALGVLKSSRLNFEGAESSYKLSNGKRPTEFSLVNEGNLSFWTGRYFDAIKAFRKAENISPRSAVIKNNLGYAYAKVHALDSASHYFNSAREDDFTKRSAETNFFAMAAAEYIPINTDSVLKLFDSRSPSVSSNALALATLFGQNITIEKDPLSEKKLNLYTATFLNNYVVRNINDLDTAFLEEAYRIASDTFNLSYREALKASLANAYYQKGKVYKALEILGELAYITQNYQGKFNYIKGLWALEQGAPDRAANDFIYAESADYKQAKFYNAIALTEAGSTSEAIIAWDTLINRNDAATAQLARQLKSILQISPTEILKRSDPEKYQFCRYRLGLRDSVLFTGIVNSLGNDNYKAQALYDIANRCYEADKLIQAIKFLNRTTGLTLTDKKLYDDIRHLELAMLASRKEIRSLANQINKDVSFDQQHQLHKMLYTALISESGNDTTTASINYEYLATANPYFEEGILAAADFFRNKDPKSPKAYDILVNAIHINTNSIRLLKAYAAEASRQGFDEYASSAVQRFKSLEETFR